MGCFKTEKRKLQMKQLYQSRDLLPLSTIEGSELLHIKKEDKTLNLALGEIVKNVIIHNFIVINLCQIKTFFTF